MDLTRVAVCYSTFLSFYVHEYQRSIYISKEVISHMQDLIYVQWPAQLLCAMSNKLLRVRLIASFTDRAFVLSLSVMLLILVIGLILYLLSKIIIASIIAMYPALMSC